MITAGQPTAQEIIGIGQAGWQVVINLALPSSPRALTDEAERVAAAGMDYIAIPVVWEEPTLDDLKRFFAALEANQERATFVHCALNYRASAFVYLYRVLRLGVPCDEALPDMLAVWEPNETWLSFIATALEHF